MKNENEYLNPKCVCEIDGVKFFEYPLNTTYLISKCGKVYNTDRNRILTASIIQSGKGYYTANLNQKRTRIHRMLAITFIANPNNYPIIDHKDANSLNNSLENLRWVTQSMNCRNTSKKKNTSSKYIGVTKMKVGKYRASIHIMELKKTHIGVFETEEEAAAAYNNIAKHYGILHLNKINN